MIQAVSGVAKGSDTESTIETNHHAYTFWHCIKKPPKVLWNGASLLINRDLACNAQEYGKLCALDFPWCPVDRVREPARCITFVMELV